MIDKKLIINFSSIIYYLIPISLLTGPLIPEIILLFINLVFLFYSIKEKDWFYFNNNFTKFFLLFIFTLFQGLFFLKIHIYLLKAPFSTLGLEFLH